MEKEKLSAKVITVSDGVSTGHREDISGQTIEEFLVEAGWVVAVSYTHLRAHET